jgi:hypothetical protein
MPRPRSSRGPTSPSVPDGLTDSVRSALRRYLDDVRTLPNEAAKATRFSGLVSELFPGTSAPQELAAGVEKIVRIQTATKPKVGFVDAYHGNAVIEFENSLRATEAEAVRQLREYSSAIWAEEGKTPRPLVCVASDCITWKVFLPKLRAGVRGKPKPEDVELEELRKLVLSEDTLRDFWVWLTSLLFGGHRNPPTAERFRIDFGAASPAFRDAMAALERAWGAVRSQSEARLAFETWQKYLAVTYGKLGESGRQVELETLFLKHAYLASVARLLAWAALSGGRTNRPLREVAREVLSGEFFKSRGIENLVEGDFFQWMRRRDPEAQLSPAWERVLAQMLTYALDRLDQDVLKGVYQELVDPKDRHDLGEYYTPEWLCESVVATLLPEKGFVSVLDPTCGSGSFLRAAIAHLLRANPEGPNRLQSVLDSVVGIDIHPLAVTISRVTYMLAIAPLLKGAPRTIQIPVYLADSLFLPSEMQQLRIGELPGYEIRFGGDRSVSVPEELVRDPELFDPAIAASSEVAVDHAASGKETEASLRAYLRRKHPALARRDDFPEMVSALWRFTQDMADLIKKQRNSIWSFIIRNSYRPAMLRGRFDFIVGNPPWLSYRYIADPDYQAEVKKRAVQEYAVAPRSQKLMTQMELATVFFAHTLSTFGRQGARLGFVMPRSVLSADQHANVREGTHKAPIRLERYWDLRRVSPLFNVPACVLFAARDGKQPLKSLPAVEWEGKVPTRDAPLAETEGHFTSREKTARLIWLGNRSALSTSKGSDRPTVSSPYAKLFRQGATIVPRSFYFVRVRDRGDKVDPERTYWAETDPDQAESAKPPYGGVRLSGSVEGRFLYSTALAKHVVPFALLEPPAVILPIEVRDAAVRIRSAAELRADGYRDAAKWMESAERVWKSKRREKASQETVYSWLDYQKKLTAQNLNVRYLVVYNAAGTNLSAAVVDRRSLAEPFVVEHKLYWMESRDLDEADYVAAILNSSAANEAIKPFQSMGLMGERDIEKKVLDLPIPRFDGKDPQHKELARLGAQARSEVAALLKNQELPPSLARRRAMVRKAIEHTLTQIDQAAGTVIA